MKHFFCLIIALLSVLGSYAQPVASSKLSPYVRQLAATGGALYGKKRMPKQDNREVCAFMKTVSSGEEVYSDYSLTPLATFGDVAVVSIPLRSLPALTADERVLRIEANRSAQVLMDTVPIQVNALPVYAGTDMPQAYTGKGVVMGVQDVGFDLTHPNFYDKNGDVYRIKAFWDQLSTDTLGSELYVGADYVGEAELLAYAHSRDAYLVSHGTHTLGTAAGSGAGTAFQGIAPEADICVVSNAVNTDVELIDSLDLYKYTSATDILGFKYIFDYAESMGQPCVISFSEGSHQNFRGDDQLYYEALSQLVGPGRIIVSSAGNEGYFSTYLQKTAEEDSGGTFLKNDDGKYVFTTLRSSGAYTLRMTSYGTLAETMEMSTEDLFQYPDSNYIDTVIIAGKTYILDIYAYPSCYNENDLIVEFYAETEDNFGVSQPFSLEVIGEGTAVEFFYGVGNFCTSDKNPLLTDGENSHSIYVPSSSADVICVGGTSWRSGFVNYLGDYVDMNWGTGGTRGRYSSVGPTLQGLIKPDVMAPGANVISSYSSYFIESTTDVGEMRLVTNLFDHNGRTYGWAALAGTSMAAPVVGGAIALWLQARPNLTTAEILDAFAHTCRHTTASTEWPNNLEGWGEIDVYRGLLYLLELDGIKDISTYQPRKSHVSVTQNGDVVITFDEPSHHNFLVSIFNVNGSRVARQQFCAGTSTATLQLSDFSKGVYVVQIDTQEEALKGSTLIRR